MQAYTVKARFCCRLAPCHYCAKRAHP